jgi:alpha-1,3-mannosylglycoprotein beta-1,4-N-acetylglucosaminyltransferase A/B
VEAEFSDFLEKGLLEIVAPSSDFYPDMTKLRLTLDDPLDRVQWRSKQVRPF